MTTIITVEAHCAEDKEIVVGFTDLEALYSDTRLSNGQSGTFSLYGVHGLFVREEKREEYQ